ncbi:MAG: XdhC/CoxI family protein [Dehalococcoidia bacterium]|nr:XdhC/CoxI family protein [Dehalococcoidia bacterium]
MEDIYKEIVRIQEEGGVAALASILWVKGSTPRSAGSKMLLRSDGTILGSVGGGCAEAEVWQAAREVMETGTAKVFKFDMTGRESTPDGLICGGIMEVYLEPIISQPALHLFGAGHIAFYASRLAKTVGFKVVVVDERPAYANKEKFPEADVVLAEEFDIALPKIKINKNSYIVIACRGHELDQMVLEWAVKTDARYIGMIGSKKKVKTVFENLKEKGIPSERLERVHAPVGLEIYSETPEEIAVSIVAELIKVRRQPGTADKSRQSHGATSATVHD